jgi:hypothetical protein
MAKTFDMQVRDALQDWLMEEGPEEITVCDDGWVPPACFIDVANKLFDAIKAGQLPGLKIDLGERT